MLLSSLKSEHCYVEILLQKMRKTFWTQRERIRMKIPYRYREIVKSENISFNYDVVDHVYSKSKFI